MNWKRLKKAVIGRPMGYRNEFAIAINMWVGLLSILIGMPIALLLRSAASIAVVFVIFFGNAIVTHILMRYESKWWWESLDPTFRNEIESHHKTLSAGASKNL